MIKHDIIYLISCLGEIQGENIVVPTDVMMLDNWMCFTFKGLPWLPLTEQFCEMSLNDKVLLHMFDRYYHFIIIFIFSLCMPRFKWTQPISAIWNHILVNIGSSNG